MNHLISRSVKNEEAVSRHINVSSHYDDVTLLDKSGKLIQLIKLKGLDFVSRDERALDAYKNRFNNLLKGFSSEFALYCWEIRSKVNHYPAGEYSAGYAGELNARYQNKMMVEDMFSNDLYLAIITKQPEGLINQGFSLIQQFNQKLDKEYQQRYLANRYQELCDMTQKVMSGMSDYGCELLSIYTKNEIQLSAPLEFVSLLMNGDVQSVPFIQEDAARILPRKRLFFNNHAGTIELRSATGKSRFVAMLAIKGYASVTYQGMLDELSRLPCEYVITQSYRFYDRQVAKTHLRNQQMEMKQSREESISQTEQLEDAFDDAASGEVGFGLHHFTLACYADSIQQLNKNVGQIVSRFADLDMTCVREDAACECSFWAQLPANFSYILRAAPISTRNMAGLACFHNYYRGKLNGNHWGDAICVFETLAGTPYYFNFHHKDVGNFLVFGAMGSGKTVLIGFLIALSMKFGGKRIIFDKDRGLEILVRAMGGVYEIIKTGVKTGFNPCQLDDSIENRAFLVSLFKAMLVVNATPLSESEVEIVSAAIDGMYRLNKSSRQLCHIASFFGTRKSGSLRNRFDQWHGEGVNAWLFDNVTDTLNLQASVLGFDLGNILKSVECKTPALMYLTYRVEQAIAGQRGLLFVDEGWLALSDDYFCKLIEDWSRTPRKKNNIFGLATQVANDTADSAVSKAINQSAFCKIFFPNPSADTDTYIGGFGLSQHEYEIVKSLPDDQHYFLLIHGYGANKETVVVRADLSGLQDDINIISGRETSLLLLDQIRAEVGDDPAIWLPLFIAKMRELA